MPAPGLATALYGPTSPWQRAIQRHNPTHRLIEWRQFTIHVRRQFPVATARHRYDRFRLHGLDAGDNAFGVARSHQDFMNLDELVSGERRP